MKQEIQREQVQTETFRYDIKNSLNEIQKKKDVVSESYEWIESCVFAVAAILLIFTFVMRTATVSGPSMVPTLHSGDRLLLLQAGYHNPDYGDVIVIDRSQSTAPPIIKRVIGREGDIMDIDFSSGRVTRNGKILDEPYINEPTLTQMDVAFPAVVPEGALFVMGDNRNHSADSRTSGIGMIDERRVMGRAVFRFFPVGTVGGIP